MAPPLLQISGGRRGDGGGGLISLSLGDQITTTLATSVLPVCSEENS